MGVSGSGKSTIGRMLALELGCPFFDGDDFHPKENIDKMASGQPLNDSDRVEWLNALNKLAQENQIEGAVIACSALKRKYRDLLTHKIEEKAVFAYLKGTFEEIMSRMQQRKDHFMPSELLQSQFDALEQPNDAIIVSITKSPEQMVKTLLQKLK